MESVGGVGRTTAVTLSINEANPIEGSANHGHLKTNMKYIFIEYLSFANRTRRIEHPKVTRSLWSRVLPANDTP
jgi:hypothetical protein